MTVDDIQITFVGMEATEALRVYVKEKIDKYSRLWKEATSIDVYLKEFVKSKGVKDDFRIDITVSLPKSPVRVEVSGENMYANIDEASDTLARRLKRYNEKKAYWEGVTPWKVMEADAQLTQEDEVVEDNYIGYVPTISLRKQIEDMSPLEEGEAIERMELLGYQQLLFKNKSTGKISMLYRREQGEYGLVEPSDVEV
ncbi:ribosome-associated translation inhibitor RaiA [Candidatus Dojkabacteria bacterium]|uniref:Ribosome-associated translation inhibitor RaiA n=1 Tax=Candidatus Dojkabacteria bacterium TaxID=2099670 RepID=A0A847VD85_9BACT|nr:ribosome-associated translation inhibitor RaiA [Candidatus Dojkabacteria bacterium]